MVIAGLALPTATAIYSLFTLAALGRQANQAGRDYVPAATVVCGLLLALITLGAFVALVQRAFEGADRRHPAHAGGAWLRRVAHARHQGLSGAAARERRDEVARVREP